MTTKKQEINNFIKTWSAGAHEVADKVTFWNTFLRILGVDQSKIDDKSFIDYEKPIKLKKNEHFHGSIDAYIPSTHVLIEQKSSGVDLTKEEKRDNGGHTEKITPFQQARRYDNHLSANERAYFYVLCNFNEFRIYDVRESLDDKPIVIELKDLAKNLHQFDFMIQTDEAKRLIKEQAISVAAGDLVSKIYKELVNIFKSYGEPDDEKVKHSINSLCVRLVFCLYAEDADLFYKKDAFYDYLVDVPSNQIGLKLKELFKVLNTKLEDRNKIDHFWSVEHPELAKFPYVNGGLFAENDVIIPPFTDELKDILLNDASKGFDWSAISPTIFGAVFESTLNPTTRRQGGMHYTSIENIHKVIDPLFFNDLKQELQAIKNTPSYVRKKHLAEKFQEKLGSLKFLDPACGSGNFLTETYLSLRNLENEAIKIQHPNPTLDVGQASNYIKVSIQQFYGIEINDFAVSVAKTAMWIAECQMFDKTKDIIYAEGDFLPLKTYVHIHEGDALTMDWNDVLSNTECTYVLGNPPFVGYDHMSIAQKNDMNLFFTKTGRLDFVVAWYMKSAQYAQHKPIKFAFVSTDSITQGVQVSSFFPQLFEKDFTIDFAYRTFIWNNETKNKALVYCVIIGFSFYKHNSQKKLFDSSDIVHKVKNITPYLTEGNDVVVKSSTIPLVKQAPKMALGSMPKDGGGFFLTSEQYSQFVSQNKLSIKYIHRFLGASELLNNKKRYCIWLVDANPSDLKKMPLILNRINAVRTFRLNSKAKSTRKKAETPTLFAQNAQPKIGNYIAIPRHSAGRRKYVPMGFFNADTIAGDSLHIVPNANLFVFGLLESYAHMNWLRTVGGWYGPSCRYSKDIVYNTFPWPTPTAKQKQKIEATAQAILDARKNYPDSSLADLYDPLTMPADLLKAHKENDKAVLAAYGLPNSASESEIVAHLFKMYEELTKKD